MPTDPLPGSVVTPTSLAFDVLLQRLQEAVRASGLDLIAAPSASHNAAARGIPLPGNAVLLVFNNALAVRLLHASVPAGYEAPMRLYVTESADRTASVSYRLPSALLAPYGSPALAALGHELDALFDQVVARAVEG
jgi:uncharacterized protein (DUF302 family)